MPTEDRTTGVQLPTEAELAARGWRYLDDEQAEDLRERLDDRGLAEGARLEVSRDVTAAEYAQMLGITLDEAEAQLAEVREAGGTATLAVATIIPGGRLAGLIMGPPGSAGFLRQPGEHVNCQHTPDGHDPARAMICSPLPDSAGADVAAAGGEVLEAVDRRVRE